MAITLTPQTANTMDLATVRELMALQAQCPRSININISYQQGTYIISYSTHATDERYTARDTCREVTDACALVIDTIRLVQEGIA